MSTSDPMMFAAHAGGMNDSQLFEVFRQVEAGESLTDFQQAVIDEAQLRGILSASEISAISLQRP